MGKSNQAADALSQQPVNPNSSSESLDDEEEWETISYEVVCQILDYHLGSSKLPYAIKQEVQTNIMNVNEAKSSEGFNPINIIDIQLNEVKTFDSISPSQMAEFQKEDTQLSLVYEHINNNSKPKLSEIHHIRSKPIQHLLLQFDWLSLIWGVLHCCLFMDDNETYQLILPQHFCNSVLRSLHDGNGHQGLQCIVELLHSKVYWTSMFTDTNHWLLQCKQCHIAKGDYTEPKPQLSSLVAHQPLELLCVDFTKPVIAKGGKENILVLTDAFSKYSQAFVTNNQKSLTVTKILVEKWFSIFGIPAWIHSDQGSSFDNEIISHLCKMFGICQLTTTPYNLHDNAQCEHFNCTLFSLMKTLDSEQKPNWPVYLPSLVFAYNATPHVSTGFQPYKLIFRHKAPMPCNNWLGLDNYKPDSFKSKTIWLNWQLNAMLHANKQALKLINKSTKCNKDCTGRKELTIPVENHVLLHDHPEGWNKIQNRYKSDIYVIVGHHEESNIYYIQLLNSDKKGLPKVVNRCQLFDLNHSSLPSIINSFDGDCEMVPSFLNPSKSNINFDSSVLQPHHYNTRHKCKTTTTSRQVVVKTIVTHL